MARDQSLPGFLGAWDEARSLKRRKVTSHGDKDIGLVGVRLSYSDPAPPGWLQTQTQRGNPQLSLGPEGVPGKQMGPGPHLLEEKSTHDHRKALLGEVPTG